jgi:cytochrome oxidase Cu insertion factor (SCO1/SenC/PrrC family)
MRFLPLFLLLLAGCAGSTAIPDYSVVPDFHLTERSNRPVARMDLDGKVWVADFIFTHCAGICPTMSTNMQKLQQRLPSEIRLVSFSVDPYNDTPEVLTEYAKRYDADSERWLFLTGDPKAIQELSVGGFKLALEQSGTEAEPITHSSRFVLVDQRGHIRGYYSTEETDALDRLVADAKNLL